MPAATGSSPAASLRPRPRHGFPRRPARPAAGYRGVARRGESHASPVRNRRELEEPFEIGQSLDLGGHDGGLDAQVLAGRGRPPPLDRKSTRLNSSHSQISYAVFSLKKKQDGWDLPAHVASRAKRPSH